MNDSKISDNGDDRKRQAKGELLISPDGIFTPSLLLLIINLGTLGAIVSAIKL